MDEQKSMEEQIADKKKKRRAILVVILCLLTITVTAYVYYITVYLAVNMLMWGQVHYMIFWLEYSMIIPTLVKNLF